MSFATTIFLSELSAAVREAQTADSGSRQANGEPARAETLTRLSKGEISVEEALRQLERVS
jgi:hypothetical protein